MSRPRVLLPADVWGSCLVAEMQLTRATPQLLRDRERMPQRWWPVPPSIVGLPVVTGAKPAAPRRVA